MPMTPYGIEPATFRFVAKYLHHCATAVPYVISILSCLHEEKQARITSSRQLVSVGKLWHYEHYRLTARVPHNAKYFTMEVLH
jgi:hypothetical protein